MKKHLFLLTLCWAGLTLSAQEYEDLQWGKVSTEDLAMEIYDLDSTAQAVVLGDEGYIDVSYTGSGVECFLRRHRRVKILNQAAVDEYGEASIYYYHAKGSDKVRRIRAQTIAPDGSTAEVSSKEIYREEINEYWSKATFSFPNVVPGSIVEYSYQHFSDRWVVPENWSFRESIPVKSSFYKFTCQAPITYTYLMQGAEYMPTTTMNDGRELLQLGEMKMIIDKGSFWMRNGQAIKEERYMTTIDDYAINIRFQASEILHGDGSKTSVYGTWEETTKELLEQPSLGGAFGKTRSHKNLLAAAVAEIKPSDKQDELVRQIKIFLNREIKWSGRRGIYTEVTPDDAFKLHEGNLAEIQYAGIAILRHFGIPADPLILSTRDNGEMTTGFPFLDQFNYVIILAVVEGRLQLLDFSDPYLKAGNVQTQALNREAFLLNEDNPGWMDLTVPIFQDLLACSGEINPDGSIEGEMKCTMRAYSARFDRESMGEKRLTDIWNERFPSGAELDEISVENEAEINEPLIVSSKYKLTEAGFANDDLLYVSPHVYSSFLENPFSGESRSYPIDFAYPFEEKTVYSYAIPEGYALEALPENKSLTLPDGGAVFQYLAREKNNKINILVLLKIQRTFYGPEEYESLKTIFDTAAQKMQDQIVLRKVN